MNTDETPTTETPSPAVPQNVPGVGFGVTSLVTGIFSVLSLNAYFLCLPVGIIAIVFGVMGMKRTSGRGMAIAGLTTGIVGTSVGAVVLLVKALGLLLYFS